MGLTGAFILPTHDSQAIDLGSLNPGDQKLVLDLQLSICVSIISLLELANLNKEIKNRRRDMQIATIYDRLIYYGDFHCRPTKFNTQKTHFSRDFNVAATNFCTAYRDTQLSGRCDIPPRGPHATVPAKLIQPESRSRHAFVPQQHHVEQEYSYPVDDDASPASNSKGCDYNPDNLYAPAPYETIIRPDHGRTRADEHTPVASAAPSSSHMRPSLALPPPPVVYAPAPPEAYAPPPSSHMRPSSFALPPSPTSISFNPYD